MMKAVEPIFTAKVEGVVPWPDGEDGVTKTICLSQGQRFKNPASTTNPWLYGPMLLEFTRYPDGGIRVTILED